MIDVHCHLEMCGDVKEVLSNAKKGDVNIVVANGVGPESNRQIVDFYHKFHPQVRAALGIYPDEVLNMSYPAIGKEMNFIKENGEIVSAIGEVGLDFVDVDENEREKQKEVFGKFISLAIELDVPIIVHSRKAEKECIEMLERYGARKVIMHYFSGSMKLVKKIYENGWSLSIPTCVNNSEHFQKVITMTPIEFLLCETDSPYSHPEKEFPNEPANVVASYKKISELKDMKIEDVKKRISENYGKIFGEEN